MKHILLGVTGSIAAYKAVDLASRLGKEGHSVHTILTKAAVQFIAPLTFQTITGSKAVTDMFENYVPEVEHISLAKQLICQAADKDTENISGPKVYPHRRFSGVGSDLLHVIGRKRYAGRLPRGGVFYSI